MKNPGADWYSDELEEEMENIPYIVYEINDDNGLKIVQTVVRKKQTADNDIEGFFFDDEDEVEEDDRDYLQIIRFDQYHYAALLQIL